jgi:hypothetical protein
MDKQEFRTTMVVYVVAPKKFFIVSTVAEAANFLFDNWPENDSQEWTHAMSQCAGVDTGLTSVARARAAFVEAVTAAGMSVDTAISLN